MASSNKTIPFSEALAWAENYKTQKVSTIKDNEYYFWYIVGGIVLLVIILVLSIMIYYYTSRKIPQKNRFLSNLCIRPRVKKPLAIDEQIQSVMTGDHNAPPPSSGPWVWDQNYQYPVNQYAVNQGFVQPLAYGQVYRPS